MANNFHVIDATNTTIQFISLDTGGGVQLNQQLLSTSDALPISNSNPFATQVLLGLPVGANQLGNVSVTALSGLGTGTNSLGNVSVTSTTLPGLSSGANLIGTANVGGLAAVNTAISGNPIYVGGVYSVTQPVINSTCMAPHQMTTRGAQLVATGVDTFNATISAGLPLGANFLGNVSVTAITLPGLSTGSNGLGNVSVTTITLPGLSVSANNIGLVNTTADAPIGVGSAPAKSHIVGGVYNTVGPSPTNGQTMALQLDSAGQLLVNVAGDMIFLGAGSNVVGIVNCGGLAGSNVPASGNPVQEGAVYNLTQPTINSTCMVPLQATTRGGLIVSTGVDTLNATINTGLPTGANLIGNVSVSSITLPGLSTSLNAIGLVNLNSDAAISAGGAPAKCQVTGGVFNTSPPSLTTGQTVALQLDSAGKLLTNSTTVVGGIATGTNSIGNVSVTAITLPGLSTGANLIGNVSVSVLPGLPTGANLIGNVSVSVLPGLPVSANNIGLVNTNADATIGVGAAPSRAFITGGVYNTSAPAPTNGQTVALQLDSAGKLLVNTAVTVSGFALLTGANVIGLVNTNADAAIAAGAAPAKSFIVGGVYNSSAPAPTTGQTVALQLDSAGKLLVNTAVTVSSLALSVSANNIGLVNTNADAAIGAGAAPAKSLITGGVFNTSLPSLTTGQTAAFQMDAGGRLITNTAVTLGALALSVSSNNIGIVNCVGVAGSNVAASGNPVQVSGVYNTLQPTINSTCIAPLQMTTRGAQIVATGVDTFSVTMAGGLPVSANNIGLVNTNADALIGVGTAPAKSLITGGVYNTSAPAPTNGQTVALQLDSTGKLLVNTSVTVSGFALLTGANNIGIVNCVGTAGINVVAQGNPVQVGGVYNVTQPTINSTCIAPIAMTSRAAQIVATGTDTFNATINSGLPTGANLLGNVSISTMAGLATSANIIGLVNTNADAALSVGTAPAKAFITGGIYNTSAPAPTNGQTMALQMDSVGKLIVNAAVTIGGLSTGANVIGSVAGISGAPSVTPTITASSYSSLQIIGGKMTFAVGGQGSGVLQSIKVTAKSIQSCGLKLYIFDSNPSNSTWTDRTSPAINAADVAALRSTFDLSIYDNGLGTMTIWLYEGIGMSFVGANLYGILLMSGSGTFSSTSDINVKLGIMCD
jgi:hypothetical protein